ncbi:MAG: ABC transporter substrate-binding protein [Chloroflexota bacterium]
MKSRSLHLTLFLGLAVLLTACGAAPPTASPSEPTPGDLTPVSLYLCFQPDVQFAPFYVAIDRGYFAQQGLDVTLLHDDESTIARLVASGEAPFGVVSGEQVLLGRAQELPLVYVFEWYQRFPVAVASKKDAGIVVPADLAGHSVGTPLLQGASYIGLEALLASAGLTDRDIELEVTGYTQVETLATDRVEAVVIYAANEPVQLAAQDIAVNLIQVSDYADLVSNGLIVNESLVAENPDLVRALVTAFSQALQYTLDNPDDAFQAAKNHVEGLSDPAVEATQREVLSRSIEFWRADRLGQSDLASWQTMQDVLLDMGLLDAGQDLEAAFTNEFLP